MSKIFNIAGSRFGRLVAVEPTGEVRYSEVVWRCLCDCGNETHVVRGSLTSGNTKSCGCLNRNNIAGKRFGRLIAIEPTKDRKSGHVVWRCLCDCGNIANVSLGKLTSGHTKSCGCLRVPSGNITGKRFGRLIAVKPTEKRHNSEIVWHCLCDCGNTAYIMRSDLTSGNTKSCGCLRREMMATRVGPLSYNWDPNLTEAEREHTRDYPEYKKWREAVYERDNYTCQYCDDSSNGNLNAHHIQDYSNNPDLRTTLSNGITLCKKHHRDFHHQYGTKNNTREQLDEWMNNKPH